MADGDYTKRCAACGEVKPASEYGKRKASKDGLHVYCKQCRKKEHADYYARNKEAVLARHKIWCEANPDKVREYTREHQARWRKSDPVGYREYMGKYRTPELSRQYARADYQRHKEKRRSSQREYCKANKDRIKEAAKEWRSKNVSRCRALSRSYKARKRGAEGRHTGEDILRLHELQRGRCACCGKRLNGKYHVDHIIPLALGGSNWPHNLQLLCPPCNLSKRAKHPIDFMQERGLLI